MKLIFLALCALSLGFKIEAPKCVLKGNCMQSDFTLEFSSPASDVVTFVVRPKRDNVELLKNTLYTLSNPQSKYFGKWMTKEEVDKMVLNKPRIEKVEQTLKKAGFEVVKNLLYAIEVKGTIAQIEKFFDTKMFLFTSKSKGFKLHKTTEITIPQEIADDVATVINLVDFPITTRPAPVILNWEGAMENMTKRQSSGTTTPSLIKNHYGLNAAATSSASQSVFEALGQSYNPSDLSQFESKYGLPKTKVNKVIGPNSPFDCEFNPNACAEASLDVEYIIGLAQRASTTYWSISGQGTIFYDWAVAVVASSNPPEVNSISYGSIEQEETPSTLKEFDTDMVTLGSRGVTVLVSSGDDGVANFQARSDPSKCGYHPSFPATSPHITAVGATQGPETGSTEIACQSDKGGLITTGGGFSTVFSTPSYQSSAVKDFLSQSRAKSGYNSAGRGYPDIAMLGHSYNVIIGGRDYILSGTSCSSPVTAAFVTVVNSQRKASGKKSVGFLNQHIYTHTSMFHRITSGENNCCAGQSSPVCCSQGFTAYNGWAPVCGWGSTKFPEFSKYFNSLP